MMRAIWILTGTLLLLACESPAERSEAGGEGAEFGEEGSAASGSFATARVHFEQNATDGDVEVVFEVKGGDDGLATLLIESPNGRAVVDFRAPDRSTLGMRQFRFESPEPSDVASLQAAYPEGTYIFTGTTHSGERLRGEATLRHTLPTPTTILGPEPDAEDVTTEGLMVSWTPIPNLVAYIVYIEQEEVSVTARIPGSTARFAVPSGFLQPGTEYQLGVGTELAGGNASFVETTFVTASQ